MQPVEFTPTEKMILELLSDGKPHLTEEVRLSLDEFASNNAVWQRIFVLKKKLQQKGHDIVSLYKLNNKKWYYQHIILLSSPDE